MSDVYTIPHVWPMDQLQSRIGWGGAGGVCRPDGGGGHGLTTLREPAAAAVTRRTPWHIPTAAEREEFKAALLLLQETARQPQRAPTIMVRVRDGVCYAANPKAEILARYETGRRHGAISRELLGLMNALGFEVECLRGRE